MAKRDDRQNKLEKQLHNTMRRMAEASETMHHDNISEEEKQKIAEKNEHRQEQIASLKEELNEEEIE